MANDSHSAPVTLTGDSLELIQVMSDDIDRLFQAERNDLIKRHDKSSFVAVVEDITSDHHRKKLRCLVSGASNDARTITDLRERLLDLINGLDQDYRTIVTLAVRQGVNGWPNDEARDSSRSFLNAARELANLFGAEVDAIRTRSKLDEPVSQSESGSVQLFGEGKNPVVTDRKKKPLTKAQYDVVLALLEAGAAGLTIDNLKLYSGHDDARGILKRLAGKDPDWNSVIAFAGSTGMRYRIL